MSMRKSFNNIIEKYGHYIIYVRRDTRFKCKCYIEKNGEADPHCPECLGLGNPVQLEFIKARRKVNYSSGQLSGLDKHFDNGIQIAEEYTYYLKAEDEPKELDMILEVDIDESRKVKKVLEKNLISTAVPMKGVKGEVEFYQVYTKTKGKDKHDDKTVSEHFI